MRDVSCVDCIYPYIEVTNQCLSSCKQNISTNPHDDRECSTNPGQQDHLIIAERKEFLTHLMYSSTCGQAAKSNLKNIRFRNECIVFIVEIFFTE